MTGGPEAGTSPYPYLRHNIELLPGQSRRLTWVHVAISNLEEAFEVGPGLGME